MARKAPKMTNLLIEETSGVDHPAHLHEGWLVVKASSTATVADVLKNLPEPMEASMEQATEQIVETEKEMGEDVMPEETDAEAKGAEEDLAVASARIVELESRIAELEGMVNAGEEMDDMEEAAGDPVEDSLKSLEKSAADPIRKAMADMAKAAAEAKAELQKERDDRADAEAIVKARETFAHLNIDAETFGPALRRLGAYDAELAKAVETALVSADAQNESADIFTEVGKGFTVSGSAYEKMTSLAKQAVSEGNAATVEQAMASIAVSNPALYTDYLNEKGA